jgi:hypothetical protein
MRKLRPILFLLLVALHAASAGDPKIDASSASTNPGGAMNGERFSVGDTAAWAGLPGKAEWWWRVQFPEPREVGAILQIVGDHDFVFRHAPLRYVWQASDDGETWRDIPGTAQEHESRCFRIIRFAAAQTVRALRMRIDAAEGEVPVLREVEFYADPKAHVEFPKWIVVVNTTDDPKLPGAGQEFIPLARACDGGLWLAQQIWLGSFNGDFVGVEPRPLCAFLSGNFKDWCQIDREAWRGTAGILKAATLPMWASCGGAQGLAILAETGVDQPWDCPHCRDPQNPKLPIYTHIGHTAERACGDYSACIFERGPHEVAKVGDDPVFRGVPEAFQIMESHCGQIEWPPAGWSLVATAGAGTLTKTQCLRLDAHPIYAAQFHIEMAGTPENSRQIMSNFLSMAQAWLGR